MLIILGLFYSRENSLVEEVPLRNTQLVELGLLGFPILLLVLTAIRSLYVLYHSNL